MSALKTVHIDTHVAAWLYAGDKQRLGAVVDQWRGAAVRCCPMVEFELSYLHEIGRLRDPASMIMAALGKQFGVATSASPWTEVVRVAANLTFTRDPFDQLIAADALWQGAPLYTADRRLLQHVPVARWLES